MKSAGPRLIRDASFELGEGCRFGEPRSDLVCHHSQLPTQPFNFVYLEDRARSGCLCGPRADVRPFVPRAVREERPDRAGGLVRLRHDRDIERPPSSQLFGPRVRIFLQPEDASCPVDEQGAQIRVAPLADARSLWAWACPGGAARGRAVALRVEPLSKAQRLGPDGLPSLTRTQPGRRCRLKHTAARSRARGSRALFPSRCA